MDSIKDLKEKLEEKMAERETKETELGSLELNPDDYEDSYDEALDDMGPVRIGSLEYSASHVLREIDPTAYRCGLLDYMDSIDITETKEYKEIEEKLERIDDEIAELESQIEEAEEEADH